MIFFYYEDDCAYFGTEWNDFDHLLYLDKVFLFNSTHEATFLKINLKKNVPRKGAKLRQVGRY